jgi:CheY-like chemotaxis protein
VLQGKRVLIVDAHSSSREETKRQVESWRMSAQAVASGSAAGDVLRGSAPFDVALISYGMPDVNGLKLAEEIRQLPGRSEMRLLLFSPLGECVAGWAHVHISACLSKPVLPARLQDALVCAMAVRQMEAVRAESAERVSPAAGVRTGSLRILVAEDNAVNQRVVLGFLERLGYRADVVANGLDAVEAVKRTRYDVVLMDGQMPEMDGEQATVLIRKEVAPEQQPWIVAMTANVLKGDRERYLAAGMNEYLPKPIRADALARVLGASPRAAGPR